MDQDLVHKMLPDAIRAGILLAGVDVLGKFKMEAQNIMKFAGGPRHYKRFEPEESKSCELQLEDNFT